MKTLIYQRMNMAQITPLQRNPVDLAPLLSDLSRLLSAILGPKNRLIINVADGLRPIATDRQCLAGVLLQLAVNARNVLLHGGSFGITAAARPELETTHELDTTDTIRVWVTHNGPGIDEDTLMRMASSGDSHEGSSGTGLSLGLLAVSGTIAQLGGRFAVSSSAAGLEITLLLPSSR